LEVALTDMDMTQILLNAPPAAATVVPLRIGDAKLAPIPSESLNSAVLVVIGAPGVGLI
jgi:hypothetical protein